MRFGGDREPPIIGRSPSRTAPTPAAPPAESRRISVLGRVGAWIEWGENPAAAIFGLVAVAALLAAENGRHETYLATVASAGVAAGLYWLVHSYATVLGRRPRRRTAHPARVGASACAPPPAVARRGPADRSTADRLARRRGPGNGGRHRRVDRDRKPARLRAARRAARTIDAGGARDRGDRRARARDRRAGARDHPPTRPRPGRTPARRPDARLAHPCRQKCSRPPALPASRSVSAVGEVGGAGRSRAWRQPPIDMPRRRGAPRPRPRPGRSTRACRADRTASTAGPSPQQRARIGAMAAGGRACRLRRGQREGRGRARRRLARSFYEQFANKEACFVAAFDIDRGAAAGRAARAHAAPTADRPTGSRRRSPPWPGRSPPTRAAALVACRRARLAGRPPLARLRAALARIEQRRWAPRSPRARMIPSLRATDRAGRSVGGRHGLMACHRGASAIRGIPPAYERARRAARALVRARRPGAGSERRGPRPPACAAARLAKAAPAFRPTRGAAAPAASRAAIG